MKTYNVKCPVCGKVNVGLDLEETGGWMECDSCGKVTQNMDYQKKVLVPLFRADQYKELLRYSGCLATAKG